MSAELIARLEAASEGSIELDASLAALQGHDVYDPPYWCRATDGYSLYPVPLYTQSLDAALALTRKLGFTSWTIEPDAAWVKWMHDGNVKQACHIFFGRAGSSTALALCIAALKAWAERDPQTETIA